MKTIAWLSAAAALIAAAPAMAQSGYVGLSYGDTSGDADFSSWVGSGSVALGQNVQIDGRYGRLEDSGDEVDVWTLGGHFLVREPSMTWGGYVGFNAVEEDSGIDADEWTAALEAAFYAGDTTFSGAVSYTSADFISDVDQWAVDGEARHFLNDNFSIQGNAGFATAEASGGGDAEGWTAGVGGEWGVGDTGFSVNAGYQHSEFDDDGVDFIGIGGRFNFGGTLLQRNREGAGMNRPGGFLERVLGDVTPR